MLNHTPALLILLLFLLSVFACNPYSLPEQKSVDLSESAHASYMQAREFYDNGDYDNALKLIKQAIAQNDRFALFFELQGDIYQAKYNYSGALAAYNNTIKLRSNFPKVYRKIGQIEFKLGAYENALRAYRKARANDPANLEIYLNVSECYIEMGELEVAYNELADYRRQKLVVQETLDPDYYRLLGITFFRLKRYKDAVPEFVEYLKSDKNDKLVLSLLGKSYYQINSFEKGLECFNKLIKLEESSGQWYLYRGIYFYQKSDFQDAESQLQYALQLDQSLSEAHLFLGKVYEARGDVAKALDHLQMYRSQMRESVDTNEIDDIINALETKNQTPGENNK